MFLSFFVKNKIFIFLILLGVASFIFWNFPVFSYTSLQSDSNYYDRVAVNFLQGNGFTDLGEYQTYTLGYESFLVSVYTFFGHHVNAVRAVQGILFVCIILFIFYFGDKFFGTRVGFWSAFFSSIFYVLPLSAGVIGKENLITFLILIFLYFLFKWFEKKKNSYAIFSAFFLGMLALTASVTRFLFIPILITLFVIFKKDFFERKKTISLLLFFLVYIITVSPYFFLSMKHESSLGLTSQGGGLYAKAEQMKNVWENRAGHFIGISFGYYFSEKINKNIDSNAFRYVPDTEKEIKELKDAGYPEYKIQQVLYNRGLRDILYNPHKYIFMSLLDFISLNSPLVLSGQYRDMTFTHLTFAEGRHPEFPVFLKMAYLLSIRIFWYVFLLLSLYGIVLLWRKNRVFAIFIVLIILYFNGIYSLVHAIPRYAIPLYPLYIIFCAGGISAFISKIYEKFSYSNSGI